jgi:type IV pilus assembly protein PilA
MYCPSCGASNVEYGATCVSCARPLPAAPSGGETSSRDASSLSGTTPSSVQPRAARTPESGAAGGVSGRRFAAYASLPLIGALAVAAIPGYRDFAVRSQISEGIELAAPHKAAVVAAWRSSGRDFASIYSASAGSDLVKRGKYVKSVDIVAGAVVITYGGAADSALQRRTLTIVPALDASARSVEWQCGRGAAPEGFESIFEEPARLTDVPDDYLPPDCRGR